MVSIRPQRDKRPPAWLEDFITGGELEESLAVQPETEIAAVHPIEMAQRQNIRQELIFRICGIYRMTKNGVSGDYQARALTFVGLQIIQERALLTCFIHLPLKRASVP